MTGERIGKYVIEKELGKGGMGVVYVARDEMLNRRVALKMLLPNYSAQPQMLARFLNEARAATAIGHEGIVDVYDYGHHTDGSAFFVMELLKGESLSARLERGPRLSHELVVAFGVQLADALAAAHAAGIIHRDLKPDNIFLVPERLLACGHRLKILDFGIAKLAQEAAGNVKTATQAVLGTPPYMSPEQCRGARVDARTDIYTLGVILYQLAAGTLPFVADTAGDYLTAHIRDEPPCIRDFDPTIPPPLELLISRCLEKMAERRFQTMVELRAALEMLPGGRTGTFEAVSWSVASAPTVVGPGTLPQSPRAMAAAKIPPTTHGSAVGEAATPARLSVRRRIIAGAVATLAVAALTISVVAATRGRDRDPEPVAPVAAPVAAEADAAVVSRAVVDAGVPSPVAATPPDAAPPAAPARPKRVRSKETRPRWEVPSGSPSRTVGGN